MRPKVSLIVLNWNGWRNTAACLCSLERLRYDNREVIVVDNGSTDDSPSRIQREFPSIKLIETNVNLGFAGGCNVGIRYALSHGAQFVWLLNNDTSVDCGALAALVNTASGNPRIGAVGSVIYDMSDPEHIQAWGGGYINFWLGRSRHFLNPVHDGRVEFITGASILLSRAAIESIGMLDESFFMYWEDADYCFRLRRRHWRLAVAGESKVWHKGEASVGKESACLDRYFNASAVRFFKKHSPAAAFSIWAGTMLRLTKRLVVGDWERARAVWAAMTQEPAQLEWPKPALGPSIEGRAEGQEL